MTDIDSPKFREHVTKLHNEYESYLKFILPPEVIVNHKRLEPLTYEFDTSESIPLNEGSTIINVQWDFEFLGRCVVKHGTDGVKAAFYIANAARQANNQ